MAFIFPGNLSNEDEVLGWLIHQMKSDEIEEITDEMLVKIIEENKHVVVVVCEYLNNLSFQVDFYRNPFVSFRR